MYCTDVILPTLLTALLLLLASVTTGIKENGSCMEIETCFKS